MTSPLSLKHELCKKRFDRAKKIIEIMVDKRNHNMYDPGYVFSFLRQLTVKVCRPDARCRAWMFRNSAVYLQPFWTGGQWRFRLCSETNGGAASVARWEATTVWTLSAFLTGIPSLDVLAAGCVAHSSELSARGDLETVKSCLAVKAFKSFRGQRSAITCASSPSELLHIMVTRTSWKLTSSNGRGELR